jgi:hypothetical protein
VANYNPHAPRIIGNEFVGIRDENLDFNPLANSLERGYGFTLDATRNVAQARYYVNTVPDTFVQDNAFTASIYPRGKENESGPIHSVIIPCNNGIITGNTSASPSWTFNGGAANVAQAFWNQSAETSIAYRYGQLYDSQTYCFFAVNQYANLLSGKRILGVSLLMGVDGGTVFTGGPNPTGTAMQRYIANDFAIINLGSSNAQLRYTDIWTPTTPSTEIRLDEVRLGDVNRYYGITGNADTVTNNNISQWTYPELQRFEASASNRMNVHIRVPLVGTDSGWMFVLVTYVALKVYYCEESRLGYGSRLIGFTDFSASPRNPYGIGANTIPIRNIGGTGLVLSPGDYTTTVNQSNLGDSYNGLRTARSGPPDLNELRALYEVPSVPGIQVNLPFPLNAETEGTTITRESTLLIPQLTLHASGSGGVLYESHGYGRQTLGQVYGGVPVNQIVDPTPLSSTSTYPWVRYWARRFGNTTSPLSLNAVLGAGMLLPGVVGSYASTPDNAALDILGDIDIRADATITGWQTRPIIRLAGKWREPAQHSYIMSTLNGTLRMIWSTTGADALASTSTVVLPIQSGRLAVRATLDVNNGAGGNTAVFYTAPTISGPWTQLGAPVTAVGVTSIFNSTSILEVGSFDGGTADVNQEVVHSVEVYNSAGTVVANPNFAAQPVGTTSFVDGAGRTWTLNGTASIIAAVNSTASITVAALDALSEVLDGWRQVDLRWDVPVALNNLVGPTLTWTTTSTTSAGNRYEVLGVGAQALLDSVGVSHLAVVPSPDALGPTTYGQPLNGTTVNESWTPQLGPYTVSTPGGLSAPGGAGNNATTPDNAALDIVGDIDISAELTVSDWTTNIFPAVISKWNQNGVNQRSYLLQVAAGGGGLFQFAWSADGIAALAAQSTAIAPIASGRLAIRVTLDVDNGAAGRTIKFYTASTIDGPWIQLGASVVQAGVTSIFSGTALGEVGGHSNSAVGANNMPILVHNVQILNGLGGFAVATPNFAAQAPGTTSFTDSAGRTWTVNGTASIIGGTSVADSISDVSFLLAQDMSPVTGFGATLQSQSVTGIGQDCGLNPAFIPSAISYVRLAWSPTSSSVPVSGFGYYEVQRSDSITDWQTIAKMTSPAASGFTDYEARIGLLTSYRIRAVDEFGFYNAWSSTVTATIPAPGVTGISISARTHVLAFTSNASQAGVYNLAYCLTWDDEPLENFTLPEGSSVQLQPMYNRNFYTAFHTLERGGEQFSRDILVQAAAIPPETLADFTSLRSMAWASVPYVCVRDEDGNRWFANVMVPSVRVQLNRTIYRAAITITEVTDVAAEVTI